MKDLVEGYEHIEPASVKNEQSILVSESPLLYKAEKYCSKKFKNDSLKQNTPKIVALLKQLKTLESIGCWFEGAEASFELMMKRSLNENYKKFFELVGFRVIVEKREGDKVPISEATIRVKVNGKLIYTAAMGDGPVNALDLAFRKALYDFYPELKKVKLLDFKVRIANENGKTGTASKTIVLIETGDDCSKWGTFGVSEDIVGASWIALADSIEYKLLKDEEAKKNGNN